MKTAEDIVIDKQSDIVFISWDQTVHQTCRKMIEKKSVRLSFKAKLL